MLSTILYNAQYLGRSGVIFCRNSEEANFDQLTQLSAKIYPRILKWLERKRNRCVRGNNQNEIIRIMAFRLIVVRNVAIKQVT